MPEDERRAVEARMLDIRDPLIPANGLVGADERGQPEKALDTKREIAIWDYEVNIEEMNRTIKQAGKLLTREEEQVLFKALHAKNLTDVQRIALQKFIAEKNLGLVYSLARKLRPSRFEEAAQDGMIGLMIAIIKSDYRFGFRFATYAIWWIRQVIFRRGSLAPLIRKPDDIRKALRKLSEVSNRLRQELTREPDTQELAKAMDFSEEEIISLLSLEKTVTSLDKPMQDSEETIGSFVGETEDREFFTTDLFSRLSLLDRRSQVVLKMRYGIGTVNNKDYTLEEIGEIFHLTRERVRQIEEVALIKLQNKYPKPHMNAVKVSEDHSDVYLTEVFRVLPSNTQFEALLTFGRAALESGAFSVQQEQERVILPLPDLAEYPGLLDLGKEEIVKRILILLKGQEIPGVEHCKFDLKTICRYPSLLLIDPCEVLRREIIFRTHPRCEYQGRYICIERERFHMRVNLLTTPKFLEGFDESVSEGVLNALPPADRLVYELTYGKGGQTKLESDLEVYGRLMEKGLLGRSDNPIEQKRMVGRLRLRALNHIAGQKTGFDLLAQRLKVPGRALTQDLLFALTRRHWEFLRRTFGIGLPRARHQHEAVEQMRQSGIDAPEFLVAQAYEILRQRKTGWDRLSEETGVPVFRLRSQDLQNSLMAHQWFVLCYSYGLGVQRADDYAWLYEQMKSNGFAVKNYKALRNIRYEALKVIRANKTGREYLAESMRLPVALITDEILDLLPAGLRLVLELDYGIGRHRMKRGPELVDVLIQNGVQIRNDKKRRHAIQRLKNKVFKILREALFGKEDKERMKARAKIVAQAFDRFWNRPVEIRSNGWKLLANDLGLKVEELTPKRMRILMLREYELLNLYYGLDQTAMPSLRDIAKSLWEKRLVDIRSQGPLSAPNIGRLRRNILAHLRKYNNGWKWLADEAKVAVDVAQNNYLLLSEIEAEVASMYYGIGEQKKASDIEIARVLRQRNVLGRFGTPADDEDVRHYKVTIKKRLAGSKAEAKFSLRRPHKKLSAELTGVLESLRTRGSEVFVPSAEDPYENSFVRVLLRKGVGKEEVARFVTQLQGSDRDTYAGQPIYPVSAISSALDKVLGRSCAAQLAREIYIKRFRWDDDRIIFYAFIPRTRHALWGEPFAAWRMKEHAWIGSFVGGYALARKNQPPDEKPVVKGVGIWKGIRVSGRQCVVKWFNLYGLGDQLQDLLNGLQDIRRENNFVLLNMVEVFAFLNKRSRMIQQQMLVYDTGRRAQNGDRIFHAVNRLELKHMTPQARKKLTDIRDVKDKKTALIGAKPEDPQREIYTRDILPIASRIAELSKEGSPTAIIKAYFEVVGLLTLAGVLPQPDEGEILSLLNGAEVGLFQYARGVGLDILDEFKERLSQEVEQKLKEVAPEITLDLEKISRNYQGTIVADFGDTEAVGKALRSYQSSRRTTLRTFILKHTEHYFVGHSLIGHADWDAAGEVYKDVLRRFVQQVAPPESTFIIMEHPDRDFVSESVLAEFGYTDVVSQIFPAEVLSAFDAFAKACASHRNIMVGGSIMALGGRIKIMRRIAPETLRSRLFYPAAVDVYQHPWNEMQKKHFDQYNPAISSKVYRHAREFDEFRTKVLPLVIANCPKKELRILVVGPATGEEMATVGAISQQEFESRLAWGLITEWDIRIIGVERNPILAAEAQQRLTARSPLTFDRFLMQTTIRRDDPGYQTKVDNIIPSLNRNPAWAENNFSVKVADATDDEVIETFDGYHIIFMNATFDGLALENVKAVADKISRHTRQAFLLGTSVTALSGAPRPIEVMKDSHYFVRRETSGPDYLIGVPAWAQAAWEQESPPPARRQSSHWLGYLIDDETEEEAAPLEQRTPKPDFQAPLVTPYTPTPTHEGASQSHKVTKSQGHNRPQEDGRSVEDRILDRSIPPNTLAGANEESFFAGRESSVFSALAMAGIYHAAEIRLPEEWLSPLSPQQAQAQRQLIRGLVERCGGIENVKQLQAFAFGRKLAEILGIGFIDVTDERDYAGISTILKKAGIHSHWSLMNAVKNSATMISAKLAGHTDILTEPAQLLLDEGDRGAYLIFNPRVSQRRGMGMHLSVLHEVVEYLVAETGAVNWEFLRRFGHTNIFVIEQEMNFALQLGIIEEAYQFRSRLNHGGLFIGHENGPRKGSRPGEQDLPVARRENITACETAGSDKKGPLEISGIVHDKTDEESFNTVVTSETQDGDSNRRAAAGNAPLTVAGDERPSKEGSGSSPCFYFPDILFASKTLTRILVVFVVNNIVVKPCYWILKKFDIPAKLYPLFKRFTCPRLSSFMKNLFGETVPVDWEFWSRIRFREIPQRCRLLIRNQKRARSHLKTPANQKCLWSLIGSLFRWLASIIVVWAHRFYGAFFTPSFLNKKSLVAAANPELAHNQMTPGVVLTPGVILTPGVMKPVASPASGGTFIASARPLPPEELAQWNKQKKEAESKAALKNAGSLIIASSRPLTPEELAEYRARQAKEKK